MLTRLIFCKDFLLYQQKFFFTDIIKKGFNKNIKPNKKERKK